MKAPGPHEHTKISYEDLLESEPFESLTAGIPKYQSHKDYDRDLCEVLTISLKEEGGTKVISKKVKVENWCAEIRAGKVVPKREPLKERLVKRRCWR